MGAVLSPPARPKENQRGHHIAQIPRPVLPAAEGAVRQQQQRVQKQRRRQHAVYRIPAPPQGALRRRTGESTTSGLVR